MTNRPLHVEDCPHCEYMGPKCSYCEGTGKIKREWYYGLDQKVCKLKEAVKGYTGNGDWIDLKEGELVKVVMCSRFGDVGITTDLARERGYSVRIDPEILEPIA